MREPAFRALEHGGEVRCREALAVDGRHAAEALERRCEGVRETGRVAAAGASDGDTDEQRELAEHLVCRGRELRDHL